jgi:hypothetical protein
MKRKLTSENLLVTFTSVDSKVLQQIQLVDLKASFGSKIDNLTRHLLVNPLCNHNAELPRSGSKPKGEQRQLYSVNGATVCCPSKVI